MTATAIRPRVRPDGPASDIVPKIPLDALDWREIGAATASASPVGTTDPTIAEPSSVLPSNDAPPAPMPVSAQEAAASNGSCVYEPGDMVPIVFASDLVASYGQSHRPKTEFETGEEYLARIAERSDLEAGRPIVVAIQPKEEWIQYGAEEERFRIGEFAWNSLDGFFHEAIGADNPQLVYSYFELFGGIIQDSLHGLGGQVDETVHGSYVAMDENGQPYRVTRADAARYGVFDRVGEPGDNVWASDSPETGSGEAGNLFPAGIYLPVPRDEAPEVKRTMPLSLLFTPRDPYVVVGDKVHQPDPDTPLDGTQIIYTLLGSLDFVLVTDFEGRLLRAIPNLNR